MKPPVLTIVTPTFNAEAYLERYFDGIEKQSIDPSTVEIFIVDGGSTDNTLSIAKRHHATILHNSKKLAEPGVALGFSKAKGSLVMILAVDNIFKESTAFSVMIDTFKNMSVTAAFPKHDTASDDSIYSRYFNTFTDPYTHFVYGNAANARTFSTEYKTLVKTSTYDVYDYSSGQSYPLIALAQGFTIRSGVIKKRFDKGYDDVLTVYSLIEERKQIAYVHGISLYHYTVSGFSDFVKKQRRAVENALVRGNSGISQRERYLTTWQKLKRFIFFPYALTLLCPVVFSLIQFFRTKNTMWFWHTYMCFLSALVIVVTVMNMRLQNHVVHSRGTL